MLCCSYKIFYVLLILFYYLCSLQILVSNACSVLIVHKLNQIYLSLSALETDVKLSSFTSEKNMKYNWYCVILKNKKKLILEYSIGAIYISFSLPIYCIFFYFFLFSEFYGHWNYTLYSYTWIMNWNKTLNKTLNFMDIAKYD